MGSAPDAAAAALRRVQDTGRRSLGEMRRLLGMLRSETTTAPQPSLDLLGDLVAEAAEAGLTVHVDVRCTPVPMPPGVQLAACRIVQEALTNTRRHAVGAATARVVLDHLLGALHLTIVDDGRGAWAFRPGHGVVGMRERAALYGGTAKVGPDPDGGFRVSARLPLTDPAPLDPFPSGSAPSGSALPAAAP